MAAQLLGTGGIASLLLVSVARDLPAAVDVALTLAMLAAFASIAFVKGVTAAQDEDEGEGYGAMTALLDLFTAVSVLYGRGVLPGGRGRAAALSGHAVAAARVDQGGQRRPRV